MKKLYGHGMPLVKEKGAWQLEEDAPEAKKGFLLNHLNQRTFASARLMDKDGQIQIQ